MGSLPAHSSPSAPAPRTDQHKGGEEEGAGFTLGGSQRLASFVPQPLLKFAPPPRNKKINTEKEKETHKTGILGMQLKRSLRPSSAAAEKERLRTRAPPLETRHPNLPLPGRQGLLPPQASYLRSHVAAGSAQTGCVTTPTEKRRGSGGKVCASNLPAGSFQLHIRLSGSPGNGTAQAQRGPEAQLGQTDPSLGRPSPSSPGTPGPAAWLQASYTRTSVSQLSLVRVNFSSARAETSSHLEPNPMSKDPLPSPSPLFQHSPGRGGGAWGLEERIPQSVFTLVFVPQSWSDGPRREARSLLPVLSQVPSHQSGRIRKEID